MQNSEVIWLTFVSLLGLAAACRPVTNQSSNVATSSNPTSANALAPANMARLGTIDDRFQSYNVEMLEVTGGKFWRAYGPELDAILRQPQSAAAQSGANSSGGIPAGMDPRLYQYARDDHVYRAAASRKPSMSIGASLRR